MQYHHTATNDEFFLYVVIVQYWLEFQIWIQYITGWNLEWDCAAEYNTFQVTNSLMVRYDENVVATTLINSSIFWKLLVLVSTIIQMCLIIIVMQSVIKGILWRQVSFCISIHLCDRPRSRSIRSTLLGPSHLATEIILFLFAHGICWCDVWVLLYIHCAIYIYILFCGFFCEQQRRWWGFSFMLRYTYCTSFATSNRTKYDLHMLLGTGSIDRSLYCI